jgi:hypothetical protein
MEHLHERGRIRLPPRGRLQALDFIAYTSDLARLVSSVLKERSIMKGRRQEPDA